MALNGPDVTPSQHHSRPVSEMFSVRPSFGMATVHKFPRSRFSSFYLSGTRALTDSAAQILQQSKACQSSNDNRHSTEVLVLEFHGSSLRLRLPAAGEESLGPEGTKGA